MRILLDENLDWRLGRYLPGHDVESVQRIGWAGTKNGDLIKRATGQFDVLITMDAGFVAHGLSAGIAVIILRANSNRLADTLTLIPNVLVKLDTLRAGTVTIV